MNRATAATVLRSRFDRMQAAELRWWADYAQHPTARERMYALYGARYFSMFWGEMHRPGRYVEFGSGPMPVAILTMATDVLLCDTLYPQYIANGLTYPGIAWVRTPDQAASETFDTALLLNVLDHTDDPEGLVRHAYRALRTGGRALVFVHLDNEDEKHRRVTYPEALGWLECAGFSVETHRVINPTVYDPAAFGAVAVRRG